MQFPHDIFTLYIPTFINNADSLLHLYCEVAYNNAKSHKLFNGPFYSFILRNVNCLFPIVPSVFLRSEDAANSDYFCGLPFPIHNMMCSTMRGKLNQRHFIEVLLPFLLKFSYYSPAALFHFSHCCEANILL